MIFSNCRLPELGEEELLAQYAFVVRDRESALQGSSEESRVFLADRYGGLGMALHGGSGRVGHDGRFEAKGIGLTPLATSRAVDHAYSSGEASVIECILELIWGEVLEEALPHGAVRSLAVLDTGLPFESAGDLASHDVCSMRGILVRQRAYRPAHFMRAIYAQVAPGEHLVPDHVRTANAINALPYLLPLPAESNDRPMSRVERLHAGMHEMVERLARQHAAARARRFMHGAITASNLTLDGRWIDYESTSHVPVFGSSEHFYPPFWSDDRGIWRTIEYLSYYIDKYFDDGDPGIRNNYVELFHQRLASEQRTASLSVLGIPEGLLTDLDSKDALVMDKLGDIVLRIAKSGRTRPFCGADTDFHTFGHYNLADIAVRLAATDQDESRDRMLSAAISCPALRERLVTTYNHALGVLRRHNTVRSWHRRGLAGLLIFGATKLASQFPLLREGKLKSKLEAICAEVPDRVDLRHAIEELLQSIVADVKLAMSGYRGDGIVVANDHGSALKFYPTTAELVYLDNGSAERLRIHSQFDVPKDLTQSIALIDRFSQRTG
ncbi:hypothetical protein [Luteimonas sp. R10]|uniref:hypothetical protein n=1 Tax=Luteimonas sp. R10 TaxID=3108176 RepID=UPI00308D5413|nr:hypothetical protein U3649_11145 [Luteimonas sp. R10]